MVQRKGRPARKPRKTAAAAETPPSPPSRYSIQVADTARRELADLPRDVLERLVDAIDDLAVNPRPPAAKKLVGVKDGWRIRKGDYRVLYTIDDTARQVRVYRVGHRSDVYRY